MELHIIFGPTASSKHKLAFQLWQQYNYPILSVDSRKVYKYANIGTNKYTMLQFMKENHSLLVAGIDFLEPTQSISAHIYQQYVYNWLAERETLLRERGGLIIHGGTGLYLDAILSGMSLQSAKNDTLRQQLSTMTVPELQQLSTQKAPDAFQRMNESDRNNPRRLNRLIENAESPQKTQVPVPKVLSEMTKNWHILSKPREEQYKIINDRVWEYVERGWLDEIVWLRSHYDDSAPALQMMGYRQLVEFMAANANWQQLVDDRLPQFEAVISDIQREHRRYAKRQETWAKRYIQAHP